MASRTSIKANIESSRRIVASPGTCGGNPRIRGTRITVKVLARSRELGITDDELLEDYPSLTQEDLTAAWSFIEKNRRSARSWGGALMAELFADEDVPYRLQDCLRLLGHNVATVRQFCENKAGDAWPDEAVLSFACERRWAVITLNAADFQRLAKEQPDHFGIILAEVEEDKKAQARQINKLIRAAGDLRGVVIDTRKSMTNSRKGQRQKRPRHK
jgi:uncharacterized protein (DUF433 family)